MRKLLYCSYLNGAVSSWALGIAFNLHRTIYIVLDLYAGTPGSLPVQIRKISVL
jgi:hypothetical protein